jgi:2-amino-4-hydroxy-6-hydroxymethyldihydropteridine diphosphokinase
MTLASINLAYIGLGSNLCDPLQQIQQAIAEIQNIADTQLLQQSSIYISQAIGVADQADYLNAVIEISTTLTAEDLLLQLQQIENHHQRNREGPRWGPRTLDLDLLLFADRISDHPTLALPHPEMHQRNFVLVPLLEIAPEVKLPNGQLIRDFLATCPHNPLSKHYID